MECKRRAFPDGTRNARIAAGNGAVGGNTVLEWRANTTCG